MYQRMYKVFALCVFAGMFAGVLSFLVPPEQAVAGTITPTEAACELPARSARGVTPLDRRRTSCSPVRPCRCTGTDRGAGWPSCWRGWRCCRPTDCTRSRTSGTTPAGGCPRAAGCSSCTRAIARTGRTSRPTPITIARCATPAARRSSPRPSPSRRPRRREGP